MGGAGRLIVMVGGGMGGAFARGTVTGGQPRGSAQWVRGGLEFMKLARARRASPWRSPTRGGGDLGAPRLALLHGPRGSTPCSGRCVAVRLE